MKDFPRALGVSRVADNPKAVLVSLARPPIDYELRALHDRPRDKTAAPEPSPAPGWGCA
jgi:hypothetical protein